MFAYDEDAGHRYETAGYHVSDAMRNLRHLIVTQYPGERWLAIVSNFRTVM